MPLLRLPNSVALQNVGAFFRRSRAFEPSGDVAVLEFHPKWFHVEPVALAMAASWGTWARRSGYDLRAVNLGRKTAYAGRMHLFQILGIDFDPVFQEHEESGRFLPLFQVTDSAGVRRVVGDVSALLHLDDEPETLAAVQYCVSELLRNVLEHSNSPDGAFICAHRYSSSKPQRVTIAVADCGQGISNHLSSVYPAALTDDTTALQLAMRPGVTGARSGVYGAGDDCRL